MKSKCTMVIKWFNYYFGHQTENQKKLPITLIRISLYLHIHAESHSVFHSFINIHAWKLWLSSNFSGGCVAEMDTSKLILFQWSEEESSFHQSITIPKHCNSIWEKHSQSEKQDSNRGKQIEFKFELSLIDQSLNPKWINEKYSGSNKIHTVHQQKLLTRLAVETAYCWRDIGSNILRPFSIWWHFCCYLCIPITCHSSPMFSGSSNTEPQSTL